MILSWALHMLIGCGLGLQLHPIWLVPLVAAQWISPKKIQGLAFFCLGIALCFINKPPLEEGTHHGKGIFRLESIAPAKSPFHSSLAMRGRLETFESGTIFYHNIPCTVFLKKKPNMAKRYYIEGTLEKGQLKLSKNSLQALDTCSCLPHIRFTLKERIRKWCHQMEDKKVGHYFASMLTGDIDDRLLAMEFRKWGLSHVLAISGFHFALIALGFGILIQLVLPSRFTEISLMVVLSIAFLYFGPSASISRAYIMITLYLLGRKLLRTMDSLNFLGVALLIELLFHPNHAAEIGFQLSYGATFGILAFYAPMEQVMQRLFPKRSRETLKNFTFLDKHGYLATSFLRKGLALSLAVHLMTLPILLYHFGNFPMLSPLFNLFIPPLLSLTILGIPLGSINSAFTRLILSFCSHTPEKFNLQWHTPIFPFELVISLITLIGTLGLTLTRRMRQNSVLSTYGGRSSVG